MAKNFFHCIVIKDDGPVYRKQFQSPEAHNIFTEETLTEWLKLGDHNLCKIPLFFVFQRKMAKDSKLCKISGD